MLDGPGAVQTGDTDRPPPKRHQPHSPVCSASGPSSISVVTWPNISTALGLNRNDAADAALGKGARWRCPPWLGDGAGGGGQGRWTRSAACVPPGACSVGMWRE